MEMTLEGSIELNVVHDRKNAGPQPTIGMILIDLVARALLERRNKSDNIHAGQVREGVQEPGEKSTRKRRFRDAGNLIVSPS